MYVQKTAYELARSQVETPPSIVRLVWEITHKYRKHFARVLDLGAADGRFASHGRYDRYIGVEIDPQRVTGVALARNARIHTSCAFRFPKDGFSLCIGNPPYVRHHDLDEGWRDKVANRLSREINLTLNRKCNLYVYFMILGLLKTRDDGLVSLVVPYEWVSRPSALALRQYIEANRWHVDVHRFAEDIFGGVLTTASISVIDKSNTDGVWNYFDIDGDNVVQERKEVTLSERQLLPYEDRGDIWALRGMSPGSQKVFTLTEGERIHAGLYLDDVLPCVTSLRAIPDSLSALTSSAFQKRYVSAGERCWLIKSHADLSPRLHRYLAHVPYSLRDTWTCTTRRPWYRYDLHPNPSILVATGFTEFGPKVALNHAGAYAVGSVCGIHSNGRIRSLWQLRDFIKGINFERRVVAHSGCLKKIEIRQLNAVLNRFIERVGCE